MPNNESDNPSKEKIQADLARIRQQSLEASRRGDVRLVAKLTLETARLNALSAESPQNPGNSLLSLV